MTLAERLEAHRGIGPGFDFLRIGLAVSIVAMHAFFLLGNQAVNYGPGWVFRQALVPMFFVLSGFLITGSAQRLTLGNFLINRSLRIIPALMVDVMVCALVIGPLMTSVPLTTYYSSTAFYAYFLNSVGWIHYHLPGVFTDNLSTKVNGALWTVPYEMLCYVVMSGLIVAGWVARPGRVALAAAAMTLATIAAGRWGHHLPGPVEAVFDFVFVGSGGRLIIAFMLGILLFQMKERVPYSIALFALCIGACLIAAFAVDTFNIWLTLMLLPFLAYMTVFLGLTPIPLPRVLKSGDYSYGIYLYHEPLQQVIIVTTSVMAIGGFAGVGFLFVLSVPAVAVLAMLSWHLIEKPILGLRKRFSFVAKVRGVADA